MADDLAFADFTTGEKARIVALIARMGKRGLAGPDIDLTDLKKRIDRIEDTARRRKQQGK